MKKTVQQIDDDIYKFQEEIKDFEVMLVHMKARLWEMKEGIMDTEEKALEKIYTGWRMNEITF